MKAFLKSGFILTILAASILFASAGCYKQKDTIAKVFVMDADNQPVMGAEVQLIPEESIPNHNAFVAVRTGSTNRAGEAIFNYNDVFKSGQAGVAVMAIKVIVNGTAHHGIIKIEQETTSEETIFI